MKVKVTSQRQRLGLGICLIALLTLGCSTTPVKWYKSGVSQATFSRDKADCEDAFDGTGTTGETQEFDSLEGCLEAKGYQTISDTPQ